MPGVDAFRLAVREALDALGIGLLSRPQELVGTVSDLHGDPGAPEVTVLRVHCSDELLRPISAAAAEGTSEALAQAALKAELYLHDKRRVDASDARSVAWGLARGTADHLSLPAPVDPRDGNGWRRTEALRIAEAALSAGEEGEGSLRAALAALAAFSGDSEADVLAARLEEQLAKMETVTVTFDANGGTGMAPSPCSCAVGEKLELPGRCALRKDGHRFAGWSEERGPAPLYSRGYRFTVLRDTVFYAKWESVGASPTSNNSSTTPKNAGSVFGGKGATHAKVGATSKGAGSQSKQSPKIDDKDQNKYMLFVAIVFLTILGILVAEMLKHEMADFVGHEDEASSSYSGVTVKSSTGTTGASSPSRYDSHGNPTVYTMLSSPFNKLVSGLEEQGFVWNTEKLWWVSETSGFAVIEVLTDYYTPEGGYYFTPGGGSISSTRLLKNAEYTYVLVMEDYDTCHDVQAALINNNVNEGYITLIDTEDIEDEIITVVSYSGEHYLILYSVDSDGIVWMYVVPNRAVKGFMEFFYQGYDSRDFGSTVDDAFEAMVGRKPKG